MTWSVLSSLAGSLFLTVAPVPAAEPDQCVAALAADLAACDSILAAERNPRKKAKLLFGRAYVLVEKYRYEDAIKDLDEAIRIDPDDASAYRERAYVLTELSEYERALADIDRAVALEPEESRAYAQRAFIRHRVGDFAGAHRDRVKVVGLTPGDPGALLARGTAALWLGRFDDATGDTDKALLLARTAKAGAATLAAEKQQRAIALWRERTESGSATNICKKAMEKGTLERPRLIGDCTSAFLAAPSRAAKAELLTIRALAWLIGQQDQPASIQDQVTAVALDPGNSDLHSNLGGSYLQVNHSWAAKREVDRALAIKESWPAFAHRAAARYNLKDFEGAAADAKKSFAMRPNEVATIVLGDLARDRGETAYARRYWMTAYYLGSRDERLLARLKSIGVENPEQELKAK